MQLLSEENCSGDLAFNDPPAKNDYRRLNLCPDPLLRSAVFPAARHNTDKGLNSVFIQNSPRKMRSDKTLGIKVCLN